jgi:hypothetical protein
MVDLPNDGANKGAWRNQLRDRFGRFVDMGGPVSFEVQLPGVEGISRGLGYFIGNTSLDLARISVKDNLSVPQGIYEIAPDKITAIQAIIKRDQLTRNPDGSLFVKSKKAPAPAAEPLKDSMLGSEVQKKKLKSITRTLKSKGRFAVPRQSNLDTWGKTSDVAVAAQADYKQVYDASPELQELYDNAEDMWFRVFSLSVSTDTSSPNDLSQIPEEMKLLNREYAKHFLGLKEDGLITVYRNAVNGKDNEIDSAAGYVSTDMSLAYDYNSKKENIASNGRYEIDVKPDEVFGMLGYSQPEDEYAFVIGKGVTSQEGRVRRVGDLASLPMPAPWLDQYAKDVSYARGATPYRHHALAGQFNFHEVDNFGNDLKEVFAKYNLTADDIKSTFDRLNGSGAYDEYRESGNIVTFNAIRDMFVDLPNGKIGLDITKISGGSSQGITFHAYGDTSKPDSYKNDRLDNTLKMLAVFQELTGQPFFTHRSRDYVPTGDTKLPPIEESVSEAPEAISVDSKPVSLEEVIAETSQKYSLKDFTQTGPQKGSNVGGTYTDSDGNSYYVKTARSELHAENEVLASAFYELAGIKAAKMRLGTSKDDTLQVFSKIIPNSTADLRSKIEDPEYKKKVQDGFAIDAWLANWDVAGSAYDNVITDGSGNPVRVDPGGALMFRARGEPKLDAFGNEVKELDSLRNSPLNPASVSVFGDMTEDQLKESASKLLEIPEASIEKLVDSTITDPNSAKELKNKLIARRKFILDKYDIFEAKEAPASSPVTPENSKDSIPSISEKKIDEVAFEASEPISESEEKAIYDYYEIDYEEINKLLRDNPNYKPGDIPKKNNGEDYEESLLEYVDNIDSAFKKNAISEDLTVYRGLYPSDKLYDLIDSYKAGDSFNEPAFLSVSVDPNVARKFANLSENSTKKTSDRKPVLFKINLKAGQPAIKVKDYVEEGTEVLDEQEILLDRNSKFKVVNVSRSPETIKGGTPVDALVVEVELEEATVESQPLTPQKFKDIYGDDSNFPTTKSEANLVKELYDSMLSYGLTPEQIASADPTYEKFKTLLNKDQEVPLKDQEDFALSLIKEFSREWNGSSRYDSVEALQHVARGLFNTECTYELPTPEGKASKYLENTPVLEALLKAVYDRTQKYFADNNIKKLVVYRGLSGSVEALQNLEDGELNDIGALQGAPMASWTLDPQEAGYFAGKGAILRSEIPVSSVFSLPYIGLYGVQSEQEVVVLGMPTNTKAVKYIRDQSDMVNNVFGRFKELDENFDMSKPLEIE